MDVTLKILLKPDNLPMVALLPGMIVLLALWWRVARRNDRLVQQGGEERVAEAMAGPLPPPTQDPGAGPRKAGPKLHAWPYLIRVELLVALAVMVLLTVWSIVVDAPLEQMADASRTPNPSKAPWYFLGLQEMLVYFDPWIAGVTLPLLIIVGLCAIPYLDVNPGGNGYYCWRQRPFAVGAFLVGLVGLWVPLIAVGVFCRGPGWHWFWPWEPWRTDIVSTITAVNWPQWLGVTSPAGSVAVGALTVGLYYLAPSAAFWVWRREGETLQRLGALRYATVAFLLLTMLALPIKIGLRLALDVKYVLVTPWFSI